MLEWLLPVSLLGSLLVGGVAVKCMCFRNTDMDSDNTGLDLEVLREPSVENLHVPVQIDILQGKEE